MKSYLKLASYTLMAGLAGYLWITPGKSSLLHENASHADAVARGAYLVKQGNCAGCHTPKVMTAQGPVDDEARLFSGQPSDSALSHVASVNDEDGPNSTAWAGPWGISYASNLTPDPATGLWSEASFIKAMRTGKLRGHGRQILPPMPWATLSKTTDADLKAIYAYLSSLPPVFNSVPDPSPPAQGNTTGIPAGETSAIFSVAN